ncbi:hypothetical protein B0H15DRAFT_805322 [Mycena belliarum]|uniref:Uncharacterized protein n=1 Tax=Mycena belliarum TaxID=1033014 RepID=A0AAD6XIM1_9AGAR|nr:hypothetical protein B0H15DRAFT_805322 [Mycena belliae]
MTCWIVASEDFVQAYGLENQDIEIVAQGTEPQTFESWSAMELVGYKMRKVCADQVVKDASFAEGKRRYEVGVLELHDGFAANELIMYSALVLLAASKAKGYPLNATGLGKHFYIAMQSKNCG